jgi:hypothetical protein
MNLFDKFLHGRQVTQVTFVHDYLQVVFGNMSLTINNNYEFVGGDAKEFVGEVVENTLTSQVDFTLLFSDGRKLTVGIADDDYHCPEAMVLFSEETGTIVWN